MPRPRRFVESASPEQIAREYAEGRSTRELEAKYRLSRWCITAWCWQHGVVMRTRDDALERQRFFASVEQDRVDAERCCYPHCTLPADDGRLCAGHWLVVAEHEGRGCAWPPVCYERPVMVTVLKDSGDDRRSTNLCDYHLRKSRGEISG